MIPCPECSLANPQDRRTCSSCGALLKHTSTMPESIINWDVYLSPGDVFAERFRIIEEIGSGGMGKVFKASDIELNSIVALKIIRAEFSNSPNVIRRFKQEALFGRSISHDNVVRIHDIGEWKGIIYISMEYIKGQNLKELIRTSGPLSFGTVIKITKQICGALMAAHENGVIHRDLKPHNIMVDTKGDIHAMDFGLAKSIEGKETSASGIAVGTLQYLSPEQAKGEKLDQRSDIYSLGIIMYEMLTGKMPFESETDTGFIQKHIFEKPRLPSQFNPFIPPSLELVVMKCLKKDRDQRYQNVRELIDELDKKRILKAVSPYPPKKKKIIVFSAAALVLAVFVLVFAMLFPFKKSEMSSPPESTKKSITVLPFENLTGEKTLDKYRRTFQYLLTTDLEQSIYLDILPEPRLTELMDGIVDSDMDQYSSAVLNQITSKAAVEYFLIGSYLWQGNNSIITVKLHEAGTHRVIGTEEIFCEDETEFSKHFDDLSKKIKQLILTQQQISADIDSELGKISTESLAALEHYIKAKNYYENADYKSAIVCLEKAVDLDPEFAMAYALMGTCFNYRGFHIESKKYIQKALSLQDRISIRERYLILGQYKNMHEGNYFEAIKAYEEVLSLYPDEKKALTNLGGIYRNIEEWDLSLDYFNKIIENQAQSEITLLNFIEIYKAKGWYERALDIFEDNKEIFPEQEDYHGIRARIYLAQGHLSSAAYEANLAVSFNPKNYMLVLLMGQTEQIKHNFKKAKVYYSQLINHPDPFYEMDGRYSLGCLNLLEGKISKSQEEYQNGLESSNRENMHYWEFTFVESMAYLLLRMRRYDEALSHVVRMKKLAAEVNLIQFQIISMHYLGLIQLLKGDKTSAENTAYEMIQKIEQSGYMKLMRHCHHLRGTIALEEQRYSAALSEFKQAYETLPHQMDMYDLHAFYLNSLADVYFRMDDLENAEIYYIKITAMTTGMLLWGDIYARSYYMLGKISQMKNQKNQAVKYYKKFLDLWQDADPILPEMNEVREQLGLLQEFSKS